jgi:hypothetical protein
MENQCDKGEPPTATRNFQGAALTGDTGGPGDMGGPGRGAFVQVRSQVDEPWP